MSHRRTLSDIRIAKLKSGSTRYALPDPELRGHYLRITPAGTKSYVAVARNPQGKQVWTTIGAADVMSITTARDQARAAILRIRAGLPVLLSKPETFKDVAENYLKRHVIANGLRSQDEIERCLGKYIYPHWQGREFNSLKRSDIARLLDDVQDKHGPRQADYVLAIVRGISNWFASRHDDYASPFTRGMRRTDPKTRKRARILDDDELRVIWRQAEANGTFGDIVRLLLLTGQRREKIAAMKWADVTLDGEWHIPAENREKGTGGSLVLPEPALQIIRVRPRLVDNSHVFPGRGAGYFRGFSPCKRSFDAKLPVMPAWVLHDLRRTARSLMSRAGVRPDIAERVLGHAISGVEGVYDRHSYRAEKADALGRLAGLIHTIIHSPVGTSCR
jgi:integrase